MCNYSRCNVEMNLSELIDDLKIKVKKKLISRKKRNKIFDSEIIGKHFDIILYDDFCTLRDRPSQLKISGKYRRYRRKAWKKYFFVF